MRGEIHTLKIDSINIAMEERREFGTVRNIRQYRLNPFSSENIDFEAEKICWTTYYASG
jgi:hypothetical protein